MAKILVYNQDTNIYGAPIYVGFAFKRHWEGGHGNIQLNTNKI